ncbi:MAG: XRE family transcriptional regulator [Proteobacteria bacterium]|nr:XRE family transcriptional regulator [Pseudomonadota bacterium]
MKTQHFESVWDAISDTPEEAENMKVRSSIMIAIQEHIARTGMSQAKAAELFSVTQPRVSDLIRGKISLFSIDTLINMAAAAKLQVTVKISNASTAA